MGERGRRRLRGASVLLIAAFALIGPLGCGSRAASLGGPYGIGRAANSTEIAPLDIDIAIDGRGLPPGRATAEDGAPIYAQSCRGCHGDRIALRRWSHPTALYDYIRRAMPPTGPRRLSAGDLYAVVAYVLYADGRAGRHDIVDREALVHLGATDSQSTKNLP